MCILVDPTSITVERQTLVDMQRAASALEDNFEDIIANWSFEQEDRLRNLIGGLVQYSRDIARAAPQAAAEPNNKRRRLQWQQ